MPNLGGGAVNKNSNIQYGSMLGFGMGSGPAAPSADADLEQRGSGGKFASQAGSNNPQGIGTGSGDGSKGSEKPKPSTKRNTGQTPPRGGPASSKDPSISQTSIDRGSQRVGQSIDGSTPENQDMISKG